MMHVSPAGRGIRIAAYLGLCAGTGAVIGRAFGAFARAPFHFPLSKADVSPAHRALLEALEIVEWPVLFGLTLASALVLWAWLRPRHHPHGTTSRTGWTVLARCAAIGAACTGFAAGRPGEVLAALAGAALGALAAAMLLMFRREAAGTGGSFTARWASQVPPAAGHVVATSAASMSLGFRGESALVHGFVLLIGMGIFCAELGLALLVSAWSRVPPRRP